jgi:hypothetical protein
MELVQLVYRSRPAGGASGASRLATFRQIHSASVARNQRSGIGGFLVLTKTHFLQILEGDRSAVMETFERIRRDERHTDVALLDITPCRKRRFAGWAMGAIHDPLVIGEAMLSCGIGEGQDIASLGAKNVAAILSALAQRATPAAA